MQKEKQYESEQNGYERANTFVGLEDGLPDSCRARNQFLARRFHVNSPCASLDS